MTDIYAEFERDVLAYNPFEGDFGEIGDRDLSDKMVKAARDHSGCHNCGGPIAKGERHRSKSSILDGDLWAWRWCWACCIGMARSWYDAGHDICERFKLRST